MSDQRLYQIAITKIFKVGPITARNLISYCGGIEEVFKADKKKLSKVPGLGEQTIKHILKGEALNEAEKELVFIEKNDIKVLFFLDEGYPQRLKHFQDSPIVLYYKGQAKLNHSRIVSIVGTRTPSVHGKAICEEIVNGLKSYDVLISSGMAYGIDITAHRQCITNSVPTVGVLGHGLAQIYPTKHRNTALEMLKNGGLLTEFFSSAGIEREHFPMRNRIIAGMCDALIVIETARKGGSMISAHMANNYSKDVFAVPGRLNDKFSQGCNHLIKTHKAHLLESVEDLAYIMRWDKNSASRNVQKSLFVDLTEKELQIVNLLEEVEDLSIDRLSYETKFTSSQMAALLLELEFKGIIKNLPGKRYVLV